MSRTLLYRPNLFSQAPGLSSQLFAHKLARVRLKLVHHVVREKFRTLREGEVEFLQLRPVLRPGLYSG